MSTPQPTTGGASLYNDISPALLRQSLDLRERLLAYVGEPPIVSDDGRTTVREDVVIREVTMVREQLQRPIRLLDVCCGHGLLAEHLGKNLDTNSPLVSYFGLDQSIACITRARAQNQGTTSLPTEFRLAEIWYLPVDWQQKMDVVVLSNTLHELPPSRFPALFTQLNAMLVPEVGRLCIVDMEKLPPGEPERIAINWDGENIVRVLREGGLNVSATTHIKKVLVFCLTVKPTTSIAKKPMLEAIRQELQRMTRVLIDERREIAEASLTKDDVLMQWVILSGSIARCTEELLLVDEQLATL